MLRAPDQRTDQISRRPFETLRLRRPTHPLTTAAQCMDDVC